MREETRKTVETLIKVAINDPGEREVALKAIATADKPEPKDKLLKTKTAAKLMECHPKSLYLWEKQGRLHPVRQTARRVRWRLHELESLAGEKLGA